MSRPAATESGKDVTRRPWRLLLFYGLPALIIFLAGNLAPSRLALGITWTAAFGLMGGICVANARRCGRTHCFFTGPWFLLAAALSLAKGLGMANWPWLSWDLIGYGGMFGAAILWCGSEHLLGRYHPFDRRS